MNLSMASGWLWNLHSKKLPPIPCAGCRGRLTAKARILQNFSLRRPPTLLGKETPQEAVKDLVARLQREGIAVANGKRIEYKIPEKKK